jgi:PII-like signaling protein
MIADDATLLRIYLNASQKWRGMVLYRAIVELARNRKLAGISVFPVDLGYGAHRTLRDSSSEYASSEVPIVVEAVDTTDQVMALADELGTMIGEGLLASSAVKVHLYSHAGEGPPSGAASPQAGIPSHTEEATGNQGATPMKIEGGANRLTVYVGSTDTWGRRNLAVAIVEACRNMGIAGATVSRGIMGFGKHSVIHKAHFLGLSDDLPEKIEIIDRPEEIARLLPVLDQMIGGGLIVLEDVQVVRYLHDQKRAKGEVP